MRLLALLLAFLAPLSARARTYFIDRGVNYHIGDNRYDRSEDSQFVGAYPVVGQELIQAFKVNEADTVKVSIATVRGVDDCPYCKVIVGINDHDMGRLTLENNKEAFETLEPLAMKVEAGRTYLLRIVSYGDEKVDDFIVEGISVETQHAEVKFLKPGPILKMPQEPMPAFSEEPVPPPPPSPCAGLAPLSGWALGPGSAREMLSVSTSAGLGSLNPGQRVDFYFRSEALGDFERLGHEFQLLCGGENASGWIFTLDASGRAAHANIMKNGNYRELVFDASAFRPGQWNGLRLSFCQDGSMSLALNGRELGQGLKMDKAPQAFGVRSIGLRADLSGGQKF